MDEITKTRLIDIQDLHVFYGGIHALHGVSIHVDRGEIVSVIGANGAGKSTLMRTIAGAKEYKSGKIILDGAVLPGQAHKVVRAGVSLVPEGRRIFAPLTVRENLMLGAYIKNNAEEIHQNLSFVENLFPVLKERDQQIAGTLSGGEQQMLAVGRALMANPRLLLLDEPSLGLAPIVVETLFRAIAQLNKEKGLSILLVEQNAAIALEFSNRSYVLETGAIRLEGSGKELLEDPRIKASYLGLTTHQI